jgi:DNA-binding LytR/AlgR family response regulator
MEAFKVNSVDYLLKPVDSDELKKSLEKFQNLKLAFTGKDTVPTANTEKLAALVALLDNQEKKYKSRFLVKSGNSFKPVSASDIAYFLIENQLVFLYDKTGKRYLVESTLDDIESTVDPTTFFRINRQMIVALPSVKAIHPYFNSRLKLDLTPELKDEEVIVSRLKAGDFKKWLEE